VPPAHTRGSNELTDAVLLTLSFFDALGMAVTAFEVWQQLIGHRATYREVNETLTSLADPKGAALLTHERGFYSLRGAAQIETRFLRNKTSEMLWRRARSTARLLSWIPFVTSVSVVNSVSMNNANENSDIDLLITVKPGRMWTARMLVTGVVNALGWRRHGKKISRRICLSFYLAESALDLKKMALPEGDLYLAHWMFSIATVWQRGIDIQPQLLSQNPWAASIFPQQAVSPISARRRVEPSILLLTRPFQALAELTLKTKLGYRIEQKLRAWQLKLMQKSIPTEVRTRTSHILITDDVLKFHEQDRRVWFRERTLATFASLKAGKMLPAVTPPRLSDAGFVVQTVGATASS
jgi:predicted nucleotidyltransferase